MLGTERESQTGILPTVLVVDDHAGSREYVARLLRLEGFDVLRASDAGDAQQLLQSQHVDLLLLDQMMPDMAGLDLLQWLREQQRLEHLPVIMLSAVNENATVERAHELGVRDFLVKSRFSVNTLLDCIRTNLAGGKPQGN